MPSLPTSETRGSLSLFFTSPLKKPRTECACQPVLAMMSSMVTPLPLKHLDHQFLLGLRRRRSPLGPERRSLPSLLPRSCGCCLALAGHACRRLGKSNFFRFVDAKARRPLLVMNKPRGRSSSSRRHSGAPFMVRRSSACFRLRKVSTNLVTRCALYAQALRKRKERSVSMLGCGAQDDELGVTELGCSGFGFGHECLHRHAPARCRRFHRPEPGAKARRGR